MKSKRLLLDEIIDQHRREIIDAEFYLDFFQKELRNPKTVGKPQALEAINIRKEFIRKMNKKIKQYEDYGKRTFGQSQSN